MSSRRKCAREGCTKRRTPGREYCSMMCRSVVDAFERTERVCRAITGTESDELWVSLVALNDAVSEYRERFTAAWIHAKELGITAAEWHAIQDGALEATE
ncbi:hypothetical protein [Nocardia lasii]|uniref:Uncharacterized protein n=1 Tax=Nocardia lasii TaxID=1616107 RepID=A0ABW1JJK7_9NOCA